jgi:hypothetical protein
MTRRWQWPDDDAPAGDDSGWNRVSIACKSRKPYRPNIGEGDLIVPRDPSRLRTLAICLACGACLTALYLWVPLMIVNVFAPLPSGAWYGGALGAGLLATTLSLYAFSRHEDRQSRELVREDAVSWLS